MATVARRSRPPADRFRTLRTAIAVEWREIGGLGRLATMGVFLSGAVAVLLGSWIEASVYRHLLDVRTELLQGIVDDLMLEGALPLGPDVHVPEGTIDAAVEHRLIGGEIVGVAIHDATGAPVYGDPRDPDVAVAPVASALPHVEQHDDGLLHLALPVEGPGGELLGRFEVFQQATAFNEVLARVRRNVWLAISTGLATLGVAMGASTVAHARDVDRRRRRAEGLLRELLRVEDGERRRIVGALHDDIGQPLYRILYGLEGCRARLRADESVTEELGRLSGLVRYVDSTLRSELRRLQSSTVDTLDLPAALAALAEECRRECELDIEVTVELQQEPTTVVRSVLLRTVQEALVNVRKHANASRVAIRAQGDAEAVSIEVVDDGRGLSSPRGLGLTTAAQRLEAIGGGLRIARHASGGTVLRAWAPAAKEVPR